MEMKNSNKVINDLYYKYQIIAYDGAWFGDIDKSTHGLKQLAVAERCGLVFVLPTVLEPGQSGEFAIDDFLGPVKDDLKSWDMQTWEVQSTTPLRPRMNWKLVIDTFLELYHFRYLHGKSVAPLFLDNITHYERRGMHSRFAVCKPSLLEVENQPKESWRLRDHAVVLYNLFPNTVLAYTADHCGVFTSYPVTPDESLINVSVLVDPVELPALGPIALNVSVNVDLHHLVRGEKAIPNALLQRV